MATRKPIERSQEVKVELKRAELISDSKWKADMKALKDALENVKPPNGSKVEVFLTGFKKR